MASSFTRFLDHTQRRTTVGRTPLGECSARRKDLYLTTHNTHNTQTSMPPGGIRTHDLSRRAAAVWNMSACCRIDYGVVPRFLKNKLYPCFTHICPLNVLWGLRYVLKCYRYVSAMTVIIRKMNVMWSCLAWGSHRGVNEIFDLLECCAVYVGSYWTFRDNLSILSSRVNKYKKNAVNP